MNRGWMVNFQMRRHGEPVAAIDAEPFFGLLEALRGQIGYAIQFPVNCDSFKDGISKVWATIESLEKCIAIAAQQTHADPGEVERLREENDAIRLQAGGMQMELDELRAQLAERDRQLKCAVRLLMPNVGQFRGSGAWAVEVDRFIAALSALSASAPVGDGMHDDTEAVRAALEKNHE